MLQPQEPFKVRNLLIQVKILAATVYGGLRVRDEAALLGWRRRKIGGWEVEFGLVTTDADGGCVVSSGGFFGGVEGSKPNTDTLIWVPHLSSQLAP